MSSNQDKEKSKGISLRKKRTVKPKISAPKQISGPLPSGLTGNGQPRAGPGSGLPNAQISRERPRDGNKTADLVKRRYSTKLGTDWPTDFSAGAPPVPSLPQIPSQFAVQPPAKDDQSSEQRLKVDPKALADPNLRPEQYVSSLLADANEEEIQNFQVDLQGTKNVTKVDLQQNVFRNRTQFIKISKEADKLKGEMRMLRTLMSELTGAIGQATTAGGSGADTAKARRIANRSSVANLEALWNSHLQTLWKRVEGSQKYLPAIPGRHIVYESSRWVELNAATWKPRRRVHLVMLNDHLLVAADKKRPEGTASGKDNRDKLAPQPLIAIRCWPLEDVNMVDLAPRSQPGSREQGASSSAVNVRVGSGDSFTFATGSNEADVKMNLLATYRRTVEDLRKTRESETQERDKSRNSIGYLAGRDPGVLRSPALLDALDETSMPRSDVLVDVDGKPQSIRWVEAQIDDLDIDIALQKFEEAVARLERLRRIAKGIKGNSVAQSIVTLKLNERASKLEVVISKYLKETHSWITSTKRNVDWLVRLGFEDRAREAYLEARSEIIKKRVRQCTFEGDLHLYIYQVSFIYFTIIKDTALIYQSCFPMVMMSACIKWAKEHVDDFNGVLERQLSNLPTDSEVFKKCMERAHIHAEMLSEAGLDFKDLIGIK
ncbi:hypothetical protein E2P81_ATG03643 [Venturia nashicola]|nr:hypothetical protein E2P81_ATG03643 [Venturia nashicola]